MSLVGPDAEKSDPHSSSVETLGGLLLFGATVAALIWANSPWAESYEHLWSMNIRIGFGSLAVEEHLLGWINDAVMTIFFFVVGIEIKQEMTHGQLKRPKDAMLPVAAALGGVVVPAIIYFVINRGGPGEHGWGIPMATDIAFAMGLVALAGRLVPPALKVTLLTLAVVDDIAAILVIAIFYGQGVSLLWLAGAFAGLGLVRVMQKTGLTAIVWYVPVGVAVWYMMYRSGVHATIAGVALGLLTPVVAPPDKPGEIIEGEFEQIHTGSPAQRIETALSPWSSFVVIPLFALANAGITLTSESIRTAATSRVAIGIFLGLVVGKVTGISATVWLLVRTGLAELPKGLRMAHIVAMGLAAGIGFTVSLFITGLAFDIAELTLDAKAGILFASLVSALLGMAALWFVDKRGRTHQQQNLSSVD